MADNTRLSIFQKFKLLLGAKKLADQVKTDPEAPKSSFMAKLDGTKSITGLLMIIGYYAGPSFGIKVPEIFLQIGTVWAGVGLGHKLEKATGIVSTIAQVLIKTNKTINGDKK